MSHGSATAPERMATPDEQAGGQGLRLAGLALEFQDVAPLREAAVRVREAGYTNWDVHTPYPVHGLDRAMGVRPTGLPWIVFFCGLAGALTGLALQWWTNATDARGYGLIPSNLQGYNFPVSGKPFFSLPANIPVIFELTILFSAFGAVFGMLGLNGLPKLYNALFLNPRFRRVTSDRYFIHIEAEDPKFDAAHTRAFLESLGGSAVVRIEETTRHDPPPRWFTTVGVVFTCIALIPLVAIARARVSKTREPRIHIVQDMDNQERYKAQMANPAFADGRAMRPPVAGTIARGDQRALGTDAHFFLGLVGGDWAEVFPRQTPLSNDLLLRGQERFGVYCAPCHGLDGRGNGPVAARWGGERPGWETWVTPTSLHDVTVRERPLGHLFNTISNGIRTMPPYGDQVPEADRWAIVSYVRALQRTSAATLQDVPADVRQELEK